MKNTTYLMKQVFIPYLQHKTVQTLILLFSILLITLITTGLLWQHFLWIFVPIIIAPFYEWYAHKFLLHAKLSKKPGWFRDFQIRLHHGHHREPQDFTLLFAPWLAIIIHLIQTYLLFALLTLSFTTALVAFTFGILYYLFYEWMHLAHHIPAYQPKTKVGQKLKRAHMRHHFHNENYCWGITNHIGDLCFGTFKERDEVTKSKTTRHIAGYTE
ncbi:sterol desaturase family protein [Facilibium subflavum]|uniref:sterol desaturase family protein n=1 Tax=Facilibium subflavum TaxID=2219058 RepID=UPI001F2CD640|nr:sterol desaturase family protein [Facilibium subflavum]